jgi:hypothetical protein
MEEQSGILSAIADQVILDIVEDESHREYICVAINEWQLFKQKGNIVIKGKWDKNEVPRHPNWIDFNIEKNNFILSAPANTFFLEIITLLYEVYNSRLRNKKSNLSDLLTQSLLDLRNRWKSSNEPIKTKEQMRLIGELIPVIEAWGVVGRNALDAWDSDGRALYDITSESWVIEAKATSKNPESVWISDPSQLDHRIDKSIFLSVTRLNQNKEGKTFPDIIDELLQNLDEEDKLMAKVKLNTQGYSAELKHKYTTKWEIHGTRYLPIDSSSPVLQCSIFDNRPSEVMKITYQLKTSEMNDIEIKEFIS